MKERGRLLIPRQHRRGYVYSPLRITRATSSDVTPVPPTDPLQDAIESAELSGFRYDQHTGNIVIAVVTKAVTPALADFLHAWAKRRNNIPAMRKANEFREHLQRGQPPRGMGEKC